jgi:Protein of unknown function (DUF1194)
MRVLRAALPILAMCLGLAVSAARAAERVDLLLVLAADVSRSVTEDKFHLQRQGYAAAIGDPRVLNAVRSGPQKRIAVAFVEWSGLFSQTVVIGWTVIDGPEAAHAFGARLLEAPRSFADRTSISGGIDFAVEQLVKAPYFAERQTIDVSGDGTNNAGRDVTLARDAAVAKGININGLVILSDTPSMWNPEHTHPPGGLEHYYRTHVIGGPGSFVMVAKDFESFGDAIVKKMIAEVADAR